MSEPKIVGLDLFCKMLINGEQTCIKGVPPSLLYQVAADIGEFAKKRNMIIFVDVQHDSACPFAEEESRSEDCACLCERLNLFVKRISL